jgi:diphthamide biosynthesis protein 3
MVGYYDEVEIEDMTWDEDKGVYHYPCPCGDRFEISRNQLAECEDIATCPSCSLIIRVVYDPVRRFILYRFHSSAYATSSQLDFEEYLDENEDDSGESEEEPKEKEDEDEDEDHFEDALENFKISDDDSLHSAGQVAKVMA